MTENGSNAKSAFSLVSRYFAALSTMPFPMAPFMNELNTIDNVMLDTAAPMD